MSAVVYEPFGEGALDFDVYQQLLEHAPVYQSPSGFVVVSRYEDVRHVIRRSDIFSSKPSQSEAMGLPTGGDAEATAAVRAQMEELTADLPLTAEELLSSRMITAADPPRHTHLRKVISRAFLPRQMDGWRDWIQERVETLMEGLDGSEPFDVVDRLTVPLPVSVIAKVLSMPPEDHDRIRFWNNDIIGAAEGADRGTPEASRRVFAAFSDFVRYFAPMVEDRRQNPQDDVISTLVRTQARQGETLSNGDTLLFLLTLMGAGNETTANLLGSAIVSLLENPDQLDLLVADPGSIPRVIEETLRYRTPIQVIFREAISDVEIAGTAIPKGAIVVALVGAANHDPGVFADPERFEITRENASAHLSFGHGIHFCVGAALARLEMTSALGALLPILPKMKLAGAPKPHESLMLLGYDEIQLTPR